MTTSASEKPRNVKKFYFIYLRFIKLYLNVQIIIIIPVVIIIIIIIISQKYYIINVP